MGGAILNTKTWLEHSGLERLTPQRKCCRNEVKEGSSCLETQSRLAKTNLHQHYNLGKRSNPVFKYLNDCYLGEEICSRENARDLGGSCVNHMTSDGTPCEALSSSLTLKHPAMAVMNVLEIIPLVTILKLHPVLSHLKFGIIA